MILVTGASGFIGRHLVEALISLYGKTQIVIFSSKEIDGLQCLSSKNYDFDDDYFIKSGFSSIHTLIHLGAYTPKSNNAANLHLECTSNIESTKRLITAVLPDLKKFVFLSTLDVYKNTKSIVTENTPLEPVSLYGYSKVYCEKMLEAWAIANRKDLKILRIGHVYGPGEEAYQKLIPVTLLNIKKNIPPKIVGDGSDLRSFIFIGDVIKAITKSLETETFDPINVVSGTPVSVKDLIHKLMEITGSRLCVEHIKNTAGKRNLVFDNTRLRNTLLPEEISLEDGLKAEWEYLNSKY